MSDRIDVSVPSLIWPEKAPENILVYLPKWLGDLVMATPLLIDLRRFFPKAKITALLPTKLLPLLIRDPNIDEIIPFERSNPLIHKSHGGSLADILRRGKYDLGLLLAGSFSSAYLFFRGGVRHRIGFRGHGRSFLLDYPITYPPSCLNSHQVDIYKLLLQAMGIPKSDSAPTLYLTEEEKEWGRNWLMQRSIDRDKIVMGINPSAAYGKAKCWPKERFKQLNDLLLDHPNLHLLYFGDGSAVDDIGEICGEGHNRLINLAGKTSLRELLIFLKTIDLFLTTDSGPMHVAAAFRTPLLAIFGSTDEIKTGPYSSGIVLSKRVECSPCHQRECPIDFRCMQRIGVEEVYLHLSTMIQRIERERAQPSLPVRRGKCVS